MWSRNRKDGGYGEVKKETLRETDVKGTSGGDRWVGMSCVGETVRLGYCIVRQSISVEGEIGEGVFGADTGARILYLRVQTDRNVLSGGASELEISLWGR